MQIDEQQIEKILVGIFGRVTRVSTSFGHVHFASLIRSITEDINQDLATAAQMDYLKESESELKEKFEEDVAELDQEMARLTKACPHHSHTKRDQDGLPLVICNVCGTIVEEETCDIQ